MTFHPTRAPNLSHGTLAPFGAVAHNLILPCIFLAVCAFPSHQVGGNMFSNQISSKRQGSVQNDPEDKEPVAAAYDRPTTVRILRTASEREAAFERSTQIVRKSMAEERRRRDEKNERLRLARLQAEQQQRQL